MPCVAQVGAATRAVVLCFRRTTRETCHRFYLALEMMRARHGTTDHRYDRTLICFLGQRRRLGRERAVRALPKTFHPEDNHQMVVGIPVAPPEQSLGRIHADRWNLVVDLWELGTAAAEE